MPQHPFFRVDLACPTSLPSPNDVECPPVLKHRLRLCNIPKLCDAQDELRWVPLHQPPSSAEDTEAPAATIESPPEAAETKPGKNRSGSGNGNVSSKANEKTKKGGMTKARRSVRRGGKRDEKGGEGEGQDDGKGLEFSWAGVEELARTYDLCATGPAFEAAIAEGDPNIGR